MNAIRVVLVAGLIGCTVGCGSQPAVRLPAGAPTVGLTGDGKAIEVTGLDEQTCGMLCETRPNDAFWTTLLHVHVLPTKGEVGPALAGDYLVTEGSLRFTPRYPLVPGLSYLVVFAPTTVPQLREKLVRDVSTEIMVPREEPKNRTQVAAIYPSTNEIPENQLKFYIHFSGPMSRGEAYERIRLLDASGKPIELPFLELGEELWNPEMTRFTLFLDPGRVKRELVPREELGPVLEAGKSYTLEVEKGWTDAAGFTLGASATRQFKAVAAIRKGLDPKTWKITAPTVGSRAPLEVRFPAPLDHALLHRVVKVEQPGGKVVEGTITVAERETLWRFTPTQPWIAGEHTLRAGVWLEDLAGNRIGRPFELDQFNQIDPVSTATFAIPFTPTAEGSN